MPAPTGRRGVKPLDDSDVVRDEEYNEFIEKLEKWHEERGTEFIKEPDLGRRVLDLRKLYNAVVERGGYDEVTVEKGAWRNLAQSYKPLVSNTNAGFILKTVYYKNLLSYEIKHHWGEEPPPKARLEDHSAKGGAVRSRTEDEWQAMEAEWNGADAEDELMQSPGNDMKNEEGGTPSLTRGRSHLEENSPTPSAGGGTSSGTGRTLREAPAKRVLYQPDTAPARPRMSTTPSQTGFNVQTPMSNGDITMKNAPSLPFSGGMINSNSSGPVYQPQHTLGPTPRPVPTPANAPAYFQGKNRKGPAQIVAMRNPTQVHGINYGGPPSLQRVIMAIRSGIPSEVDWGLSNLLEFTFLHGDDLRLVHWAGLAEELMSKVGSVSSIIKCSPVSTINGHKNTNGTSSPNSTQSRELSEKDTTPPANFALDKIHTPEWIKTRNKTFEAALCIRNMVILEDNAKYLALQPTTRDVLVNALRIDPKEGMELRLYCLEIIEQLATFMTIDDNDRLFSALQDSILSNDRGESVTALRALARLVIRDETNQISKVSEEVLMLSSSYLLLPDEDIVSAVLDLFYQYTSTDENVDTFLEHVAGLDNVKQIARLLSYGAVEKWDDIVKDKEKVAAPLPKPAVTTIPLLPAEVVKDLQGYPEPERAGQWMKCCFEANANAEITQIALWQAYQQRFTEFVGAGRALLPAADFIKNVSVAFKSAAAMVVPTQNGQPQKFIIKGIRPRSIPLSVKGQEYLACPWKTHNGTRQCDKFKLTPKDLYYHILEDHLPTTEHQRSNPQMCHYGDCKAFRPHGTTDRRKLVPHIRCHMPDKNAAQIASEAAAAAIVKPKNGLRMKRQITPVDEKGEPLGVPFSAALVLRNLSRAKGEIGRAKFEVVKEKVFEVMSENKAMGPICTEIWNAFVEGKVH